MSDKEQVFAKCRVAADPVHGAALCDQLSRPGECRLRRADHEPAIWDCRPRSLALAPSLFFISYMRCSRSPRRADPGALRRKAHGVLLHDGLGRRVRGQRLGPGRDRALLRRALSSGHRRGGILPRHDPLSHLLVSAGLSRPLQRAFLCRRFRCRLYPRRAALQPDPGMDGIAGLRGWQWLFIIEGLAGLLPGFRGAAPPARWSAPGPHG